ncbi:MAG: DUF86 domain-containing protein [Patescibacteria group bacterium]|nr:DUF86 domain-containing protein [Patescibacteria group bacterium]
MTQQQKETIQDKLFRLKTNTDFVEDILGLSDQELLEGNDPSKYIALEHLLQLSIQIILDVGSHILAQNFHENPATYNDVILSLGKHDIIKADFAKEHEEMAKFRNKLVHDYDNIDRTKVIKYARSSHEVFKTFSKAFTDYIVKSGQNKK